MKQDRPTYPYRQFPTIRVTGHDGAVSAGSDAIKISLSRLRGNYGKNGCGKIDPRKSDYKKTIITVECYPGVDQEEVLSLFSPLDPVETVHSDDLALAPEDIDAQIRRDLTDDPVFAIMTTRRLEEFFPPENLEAARRLIDAVDSGIVLVYGVGASLVCQGDVLILRTSPGGRSSSATGEASPTGAPPGRPSPGTKNTKEDISPNGAGQTG